MPSPTSTISQLASARDKATATLSDETLALLNVDNRDVNVGGAASGKSSRTSGSAGGAKNGLDVRSRLYLSSAPLMEVAEATGTAVYTSIRVTASHEPHSRLVTNLPPYTRFKILATTLLAEGGETRACIALEGSIEPLGWLTAKTAFGSSFIQLYARPLYEVTHREPLKVRQSFEPTSRFVLQLAVGTRLHVVETRRLTDGTQRVRVRILGEDEACGWATSRKADGRAFMGKIDPRARLSDAALAATMALRAKRRAAAVGASGSGFATPDGKESQKGSFASERGASDSPSEEGDSFKRERAWSAKRISLLKGGGLLSMLKLRDGGAVGSFRRRQSVELPGKPSDMQGGGGAGILLGAGAAAAKTAAPKPVVQVSEETKLRVADEMAKDFISKQMHKFLKSSAIEEKAAAIDAQANDVAETIDPNQKTLRVQLGDWMNEKDIKVSQLMNEWDPNGDGKITGTEFRVQVRKIFKKIDVKAIDGLFSSLDDDGSGNLDVDEMKAALRRIQVETARARAEESSVQQQVGALRAKAAAVREIAETTAALENAVDVLNGANMNKDVAAKLGQKMIQKKIKIHEIATKVSWPLPFVSRVYVHHSRTSPHPRTEPPSLACDPKVDPLCCMPPPVLYPFCAVGRLGGWSNRPKGV